MVRAFLFLPPSCRTELHHFCNATIECSFVERRVCSVLRVLQNTPGCAFVLHLVQECIGHFLFTLEVWHAWLYCAWPPLSSLAPPRRTVPVGQVATAAGPHGDLVDEFTSWFYDGKALWYSALTAAIEWHKCWHMLISSLDIGTFRNPPDMEHVHDWSLFGALNLDGNN